MRVPSLLALLLVLSLALAACGDDDGEQRHRDDAPPPPATAAASRSTPGATRSTSRPLVDRFKKQNPDVDVKVRYGDSAELAATIREEGDRSPADLFFSQDAGALGALQDEGLLAALPAGDARPGRRRSTARPPATGSAPPAAPACSATTAASRQGDELPDSVFDLTEPALEGQGRLGARRTPRSSRSSPPCARPRARTRTKQWLEDMQANDVQSYEKNSIIRDAIADGEIEAGLINHYYILEGIREGEVDGEDYPVKLHFFPDGDVGSLVNVAGTGVLKSAEQGGNAQKFTDFLLAAAPAGVLRATTSASTRSSRASRRTRRCRRSRTSRRRTSTSPIWPTSRARSSCCRRPAPCSRGRRRRQRAAPQPAAGARTASAAAAARHGDRRARLRAAGRLPVRRRRRRARRPRGTRSGGRRRSRCCCAAPRSRWRSAPAPTALAVPLAWLTARTDLPGRRGVDRPDGAAARDPELHRRLPARLGARAARRAPGHPLAARHRASCRASTGSAAPGSSSRSSPTRSSCCRSAPRCCASTPRSRTPRAGWAGRTGPSRAPSCCRS